MRKVVGTTAAPTPLGVYSQAIVTGDLVFVSGQVPVNPASGELELGDVRSQTRRVLENIRAILEASGSSMRNIVRLGVFLADTSDFAAMNEVFGEYFTENPPARTTVGCTLPRPGLKVEIDCIATVSA